MWHTTPYSGLPSCKVSKYSEVGFIERSAHARTHVCTDGHGQKHRSLSKSHRTNNHEYHLLWTRKLKYYYIKSVSDRFKVNYVKRLTVQNHTNLGYNLNIIAIGPKMGDFSIIKTVRDGAKLI